jgi:Rha family phage regulatory protein
MEISLASREGSIVVRSTEIAEHFGKRHNNVLRDIDTLIREAESHCSKLRGEFFTEAEFVNGRNRTYREFLMNRDGFALLAMGFTGEKALRWKLKYIEAFNAMESTLASQGKGLMQALCDAVSAFEEDKEKASQYGKTLSTWKKIKDQHIEAIIDANKKTQMLLDLK